MKTLTAQLQTTTALTVQAALRIYSTMFGPEDRLQHRPSRCDTSTRLLETTPTTTGIVQFTVSFKTRARR